MTAHEITINRHLYNRGTCQVSCSCGDFLEEHPTAGKATMAGLVHVRERQEAGRQTEDVTL